MGQADRGSVAYMARAVSEVPRSSSSATSICTEHLDGGGVIRRQCVQWTLRRRAEHPRRAKEPKVGNVLAVIEAASPIFGCS